MIDISRESEINLINILIDLDIISGKDLIDIKKASSEGEKSQLDAVSVSYTHLTLPTILLV